ncbi:MAG: DUF11 domain-containing protein [Planctomycetaceae bacterium]|jgi:uncharacterized repeat protein (TIGR01451 family)|nr:DUF11 domain-containing protein [Planctomycetaceae bacterium]MBT6155645.1 DUF11 domain-containing protein [Planctomycetaceae bacterium]MBT6486281.1 DUF11 domain-containing protein [Planctomycetaceae bacterium]MBT6494262.1 DUF11 domain-containing protein [Planctomycetaceae bacterium]
MQKSIWKLAALAGVIGVGFLGVMQAQRGLTPSDDEKNAKTQFEDFDSSGLLDENGDTVVGKETDDELGFGQFEPIDENDGRQAAADPNSDFQVARADTLRGQSDPFDETPDDTESSAPSFDDFVPQKEDNSEADSRPSAGLDFGSDATAPANGLPEKPGTAQLNPTPKSSDDPFFVEDDNFQPIEDDDTPTPKSSADGAPLKQEENPSRPPVKLTGPNTVRDDNSADNPFADEAQAAEAKDTPEAPASDADESDNPFADNGPKLLAPADDSQPMAEPVESAFDLEPKQDAPDKDAKSDEPLDAPFERSPRVEPPAEKNGFDDLPAFGDLDEPKAKQPPAADDAPLPDPNAFDDAPKSAASPKVEEAPPSNNKSLPSLEPLGKETVIPQVKRPEIERVPYPKAESQPQETPAKTAEQPTEQPKRLTPLPKAVRLVPPTDDDLAGDATVDANSPRGQQRPQLSIVKQAPPNAVLGQSMIYSIVVKNVGNSPAAQVTVEDHIPRGTKLTGTIPQAEMYKKTLVWKLGTLKPNEQRKIQVRVVPFEAGEIGSVATVNFVTEVAARTLVTSPSLKLSLASPPRANVGGKVTLTFKVTNNGTSKATGVVLRNLVPQQLSHPGGKDLEYDVGDLDAGQTKDINLQLTAAKVGQAVSKAVITADGNLNAEATANIDVVGSQLELTRSGPKRRYLGRPAKYTNRVTNKAGTSVGPITIVETIPAGLQFVKATNGGQFNQAQRTVAWQIDQLAAGESQEVGVELAAITKGTQSSRVTAVGPSGGAASVESQTDVVVGSAALSANVTGITGPTPVGETVTLQVRVANRGNEPASGVKVRLQLSEQLTFVTSAGPVKATAANGEVSFAPLQAIGPQKEQTLTIVLKATRPGEARVKVQIDSDQLSRPLTRDDALFIEAANP